MEVIAGTLIGCIYYVEIYKDTYTLEYEGVEIPPIWHVYERNRYSTSISYRDDSELLWTICISILQLPWYDQTSLTYENYQTVSYGTSLPPGWDTHI